jgi:hypothetical protein
MAKRRSTGSLVLGAVLVTAAVYAGYRYLEKDKKRGIRVGGAHGLDYVNDADARSDKRASASMYLMKPYQIFNPGGGMRPFEIDAQGAPTGRALILPGEPATAGGVVVSGQSGPAIVGGQSGPMITGGQSGPSIVGAWDYAGYGHGHGGHGGHYGHHHPHYPPPPPPDPDPMMDPNAPQI